MLITDNLYRVSSYYNWNDSLNSRRGDMLFIYLQDVKYE